jgi:hypothetical protein
VTNLHFNFKDVFRAARLGFSAKKIWVTFIGFLCAFIGYGILSYLAYLVAGIDIGQIWDTFRLVPMYPAEWPWFSWLIYIVGVLWWICVSLFTGVAVSKITYEQLKGDDFYEIKEAIKFTFRCGKSTILAPLVLILFMAILIFMGIVLALILWIPYLGQLFFAVMAIPTFAVCMFILYLVIVTIVCFLIGPSIVGTTGNDTFDTLFESFSVINDQPWRFITYEVILHALVCLGMGILGLFAAKAIFLCHDVFAIIVPLEKLDNIFMNAAHYVKIALPPLYPESIHTMLIEYLDSIGMVNILFPGEYIPAYESWAGSISSFILGIIYYLIVLFVTAFGGAIYWAGNTLIFTVLVKKKDDKNLLEIKEEKLDEIQDVTTTEPSEDKKEDTPEATEKEGKPKRTRKKKESEDA